MSAIAKQDVVWENSIGLDGSALIPYEFGGTLQPTKPTLSVMDLGKMLLHCAREGETAKVRELMTRGAPFTTDWLGTSPLHVAASNNHYDTCEVLLRAGISKNARTKVDRTPLHFAVYEGHEQIVELLLQHKCDVDAKDMLKMTPLHWSVERKHNKIVDLLLKHGADPAIKSKFDKTPITIAVETAQNDVFQELLASKLRIGDPEQQQAEESLVYEMSRTAPTHDDDQPPIEIMQSDDIDTEISCSSSLDPCTEDYATSQNDECIISDYDQMNESNELHFDDKISKFDNDDESKTVDTSTLQILKDHGISMLEDTDNTLLNSALQSGRKLVLSDAGKLILNDMKFKKIPSTNNSSSNLPVPPLYTPKIQPLPALNPISANNNVVKTENVIRRKPTILMPAIIKPTQQIPLKTNKVIKILSAEEFKLMCGSAGKNTLKKISSDFNGPIRYQTISNSNILTQLKNKKAIFNKPKIGPLTEATKSSTLNEIKITGIKPIGNHIPQLQQKSIPTTSMNISVNDHLDSDLLSRISSNNNVVLQSKQPATNRHNNTVSFSFAPSNRNANISSPPLDSSAPPPLIPPPPPTQPMGLSEIERQLLELKKQTDELRKQLELSQKQNEEYKVRLEKLEQEKDLEKAERLRQYSNS